MKRFRNLGIGVKLILLIDLLLIFSLGTIGILSYVTAKNALKSEITASMLARPSDLGIATANHISLIKSEFDAVALTNRAKSMDWTQQKTLLLEYFESLECKNIGVADLYGNLRNADETTAKIDGQDYYKRALNGETVVSDPVYDEVSGDLLLYVACPIASGDVLTGVLVGSVNYDEVFSQLSSVKIAETGYVWITNKDGVCVYHPNAELVIKSDNNFENVKKDPSLKQLTDLQTRMISGETLLGKYTYKGVTKHMSFAPIPSTDWFIAATAPNSELYKSVNNLKFNIIILSLFFLLLAVAISLIFIRKIITKPIKMLISHADRLALGDTEMDIDANSNDEIGHLVSSFGHMVDNIKSQSEAMQKIADGNLEFSITEKSEKDILTISIKQVVNNLTRLAEDAETLVESALDGKLSKRADASRHSGAYKKIVDGVNKTLDAVILPVQEASEVLGQMSLGNLHTSVKGNYKGDHAVIKDALNNTLNTVSSYVDGIADTLSKVAKGELNTRIDADYQGDFIIIKNSINHTIQTFRQLIGEINAASDQVAAGTRQLSEGGQTLSQGSTEQAAAVEEFTASITQIAAQTKQNAANANQAKELAQLVQKNATEGNTQMNIMLDSMKQISESSASINTIIKVIDDIAFQTNILALNAAVEAAHAGAHGKGFAVVADEVRNLAARSASAAKETTSLIEGSIKKIDDGTRIANQTAETLEKIVGNVEKSATIVSEIAVASNEQATAIAQINKGIEQVSQVTQANSATAVQSAATSEQLASQAQQLKEMVLRFKTGDGDNIIQIQNELVKSIGHAEKPTIILDDKEFGKYC